MKEGNYFCLQKKAVHIVDYVFFRKENTSILEEDGMATSSKERVDYLHGHILAYEGRDNLST